MLASGIRNEGTGRRMVFGIVAGGKGGVDCVTREGRGGKAGGQEEGRLRWFGWDVIVTFTTTDEIGV